MAIELKARPLQRELNKQINDKDWPTALKTADQILAIDKSLEALNGFKFQTLLLEMKEKTKAYDLARWALKNVDDPSAFSQMAYVIVFMAPNPQTDDLALAWDLASKATEVAKTAPPSPLNTLGRISELRGDKAAAVSYYKRALAIAKNPPFRKQLEDKIKELGGA